MAVSVRGRQSQRSRRGRHAIQRARSAADASRLRQAQLMVPRGLHRTRVSEMRGVRPRALVRLDRTSPRGPCLFLERTLAERLSTPL